ncbi:MAG: 4-(cytidine 5'-diphospho)-2-C-methyl-D-erythritol kinase [Gemmatimonadales bacterium]
METAKQVSDSIAVAAHAKVNLFLRVLAREQSGFHSLETLFALLELHDTLTVERVADGIELQVDGADTGPVEENLVYRAAGMVLEATGTKFGVRVHLHKSIPVRAGLGGGSTDGAAALHAVNALADGRVPRHEILQLAAKLGSDVAFFASGAPMALGWGRGERLFAIRPPHPAHVLVAVPHFGVSTAKAYRLLADSRARDVRRGSVLLDAAAFETWGGIGRLGGNDFEPVVFGKEPLLRDLFERMAQTRPLMVRMSGSGSAVFAIYKNATDLDAAAMALGERDQMLIRTMTRGEPVAGPAQNPFHWQSDHQ